MINSIIEAVSIALHSEFGNDCKIYMDDVKQGLKEPCFFIFCINPTNRLFLGRRYFRENQFCIQYLPGNGGREHEACHAAAERLFFSLEWIIVDGDLQMGTKMRYEIVDGTLHFFVNYDLFVYKGGDDIPAMREMKKETSVKG